MNACAVAAPALAQSRLPANGFADLNERLSPAVVNIATSQRVEGVEDLPRFPPGSPMERFNEGIDLSGGEWQKIATARAYMRDADLLILDEPTSALDARAEYEVFQRFKEHWLIHCGMAYDTAAAAGELTDRQVTQLAEMALRLHDQPPAVRVAALRTEVERMLG